MDLLEAVDRSADRHFDARESLDTATPGEAHSWRRRRLRLSATSGVVNLPHATARGAHNEHVTARRVGWTLMLSGAAAVLAIPVAGLVGSHPGRAFATAPLALVYYGTGAVAFRQRPDERTALRLLAFGASFAATFAIGYSYSAWMVVAGTPSWSTAVAVLLEAANWAVAATTLALFAVFPDGVYHRRYERWATRGAWLLLPVLLVVQLVASTRLDLNTPYVWSSSNLTGDNPLGVHGLGGLGAVAGALLSGSQVLVVVGVVLLVLRYRRASAETRRQIAWPLYALALFVAGLAVLGTQSSRINARPWWEGYLLFYPVLLVLPAGLLIGMLRHRLLDIDLVVRRSAIYGTLWVLIAGGYVAIAAAFGVLVGRRVPLDLAVLLTIFATVVVAPARRRLERVADRLAYGRRLSGYELISALGSRLESSLAPDEVAGAVAAGVREGLGSRWVRVVLDGQAEPVAAAGRPRDADEEPVLSVPLGRGEVRVGTIECGPKSEGAYRPADEELLRTLGRQAALALSNARLADELSRRLGELAASRTRLVEAEEAGRRRLERDLHDGVQQELVALLARLGMARNQLRRDGGIAEATLVQVHADARRTLESLQEVARGIHPPVLTDRGLLEAVEERVTRLPLPARVSETGLGRGTRLDPGVEGAAYFVVSEALGNVLKHARATQVRLCLALTEGVLVVEVGDDGCGFDPERSRQHGLRGLVDRVEALGGRLDVASTPGRGTTLRASLPAQERADA